MITTTLLSPSTDPVTTVMKNTSYPSHLQHALIIDLDPIRKPEVKTQLPLFLNQLRSIAEKPIDMLQFRGDTPQLAIWEALEGLKHISHLEMLSGYDEHCNIEPLDRIGRSWPLQSLVIGSACGEDISTNHLLTITSLTLEYCCGLSFKLAPASSSSKLQRLVIIENDACDHFIQMKEETCLIQHLVELKIQSTNGCDFAHQYGKECFGKALSDCHSLKLLDLTLHDSSEDTPEEHYLTELPASFPSNVEVLQFRGPPSLANHLSVWYQCIANPQWLPRLKSIQFCLDVRFNDREVPPETINLAHEQSSQLLKELVCLRPSVTILNEHSTTAAINV